MMPPWMTKQTERLRLTVQSETNVLLHDSLSNSESYCVRVERLIYSLARAVEPVTLVSLRVGKGTGLRPVFKPKCSPMCTTSPFYTVPRIFPISSVFKSMRLRYALDLQNERSLPLVGRWLPRKWVSGIEFCIVIIFQT